ncbi:glucose oxidase [Apiospora rasikravindrae]|uniref:Glucose oxidase n=1 Tax=Apiospora rasikravindrae TaxID=990691 RepID=A0ABR1RXV6_9PEZI
MAGGGRYDYVVAGAGTAGLVVASRLSADPSTSVLVIEPGGDERANPNVTSPLAFTVPFDATTPQKHLANRSLEYHQGKAIGGTSTINGMTYVRGDAAEFDAWATLGNPGWDWNVMYPYYLRSEAFAPPPKPRWRRARLGTRRITGPRGRYGRATRMKC